MAGKKLRDSETEAASRDAVAKSQIAVSPEEQIALIEHKRLLAKARYDLSVRRGKAWDHPAESARN